VNHAAAHSSHERHTSVTEAARSTHTPRAPPAVRHASVAKAAASATTQPRVTRTRGAIRQTAVNHAAAHPSHERHTSVTESVTEAARATHTPRAPPAVRHASVTKAAASATTQRRIRHTSVTRASRKRHARHTHHARRQRSVTRASRKRRQAQPRSGASVTRASGKRRSLTLQPWDRCSARHRCSLGTRPKAAAPWGECPPAGCTRRAYALVWASASLMYRPTPVDHPARAIVAALGPDRRLQLPGENALRPAAPEGLTPWSAAT